MFAKRFAMKSANFFLNEVGLKSLFCKNTNIKDWYLFEILHTSSAVKICKNVVKTVMYLFEILETSLTVKRKGKCGKNWMFSKTFAMEGAKYFSK